MTNEYLTILIESLQKKMKVMDEIQVYNEKQYQMFKDNQVSLDDFDRYVEEKGKLIEKLSKLDDGFELIYDKIAAEVAGNKERYAGQIKVLQALIREVTDKSVTIQTQEARNKGAVEQYFRREKQNLGQKKRSSAAAMNYYKNMSSTNVVQPQFMDKKK